MKKVCIIGAGPSGITAIKNLRDKNIEVLAFDNNHDVGGNWIYNEEEGHSSVFETTHIISSKTLSQYEDFTFDDFDKSIPDYPSHEHLRRYFQAYSKHFDLYPYIQFKTLVKSCTLDQENNWLVLTEKDGIEKKMSLHILLSATAIIGTPDIQHIQASLKGNFSILTITKKRLPLKTREYW